MITKITYIAEDGTEFDDEEIFRNYENIYPKIEDCIHMYDHTGALIDDIADFDKCEYLDIDNDKAAEYFVNKVKETGDNWILPWGETNEVDPRMCDAGRWFWSTQYEWIDYEDIRRQIIEADMVFD
ncbi:MAG: hypothetical protein NC548_22875 [Lachnospiraceae bacterium]|nr:hypothetical protein [Lachnospiraceae bacterium]